MALVKEISEYINQFPEDTQITLKKICELVKQVVPEAKDIISYKMPTFDFGGNRFYFAANKKDIGFYAIYYPTDFEKELVTYRSTKDTIKIPLGKDIPYDLICKLIEYKLLGKHSVS